MAQGPICEAQQIYPAHLAGLDNREFPKKQVHLYVLIK